MNPLKYLPLVLKQITRRQARTLLTVSGVAVAMFLFAAVQAMQAGVKKATQTAADETTLIVYRQNRYCPFASRFPFELCLLPKQPWPHFDELDDEGLRDLAEHLKRLLERLEAAADDPSYNFVLRTAPYDRDVANFSWRLEILPRIGSIAGFEWGTGWHINPLPPETAADRLRSVP